MNKARDDNTMLQKRKIDITMKKIVLLLLLFSLCGQVFAQEPLEPLIIVRDTIPYPEKRGEALFIKASPMMSTSLNSYQLKKRHWMHYDYINSTEKRVYTMTANIYVYVLSGIPEIRYNFYYGGHGERMSEEEYQSLNITRMDLALPKIQHGDNKWTDKVKYTPDLWEVFRWQHPNLYIVAYDSKRKGYYRYRIAMVVYCDESHPNATYYDE